MVWRLTVALIAGLMLTACGGGDGGETAAETTTTTESVASPETPQEPTTTTAGPAPETTEGESGGGSTGTLSQACQDLWVEYVRELDPILDGRALLSLTEAEADELTAAVEPIEEKYDALIVEANCPDDIDLREDFETLELLLELTEREAPGALPFIEFIAQQAGYYDDDAAVSGDCEEDLAALEALIDDNGVITNLDVEEQALYTTLVSSMFGTCQAELTAFMQSDKHQAFVGG